MKKILLFKKSIIFPIASLPILGAVACGTNQTTDLKEVVDETAKSAELALINGAMFSEYKTWAFSPYDVAKYVFNAPKVGILNLDRLIDFGETYKTQTDGRDIEDVVNYDHFNAFRRDHDLDKSTPSIWQKFENSQWVNTQDYGQGWRYVDDDNNNDTPDVWEIEQNGQWVKTPISESSKKKLEYRQASLQTVRGTKTFMLDWLWWTRFTDYRQLIEKSLDASVMGINGQPQSRYNEINPVRKWTLRKSEMITNKNRINDLSLEIKAFLDANKDTQYVGDVIETTPDTSVNNEFTSGVYDIVLFAKKPISDKIKAIKTMWDQPLKDANGVAIPNTKKMGVDISQIQSFQGTYTLTAKRGFFNNDYQSFPLNIFGPNQRGGFKTTPQGAYKDRAVQDFIKTWTAWGPFADLEKADTDLFNDVVTFAYYEYDKKDGIFTLCLTLVDISDVNNPSSNTTYIKVPEINQFAKNEEVLNIDKMRDILKNNFNFKYYYDFYQKNQSLLGTFNYMGGSEIVNVLIDLSSHIKTIAATSKLVADGTNDFLKDLFASIKSNNEKILSDNSYVAKYPYFDLETFQRSFRNFLEYEKYKGVLPPIQFWGSYADGFITFSRSFYHIMNLFLNDQDGQKYVSQIEKIQSAQDFYDVLYS